MLKTLQELISESTGAVQTMDPATARRERAENGGYLIDVREPQETPVNAVPGAHNIPRGILEMQITALCPDADDPIFVHCASGGRARLSAVQLMVMGYRNVVAITGSVEEVCRVFNDE
jgi:phage shock protein E